MRGTPFNAAYDNYLVTYSEFSASIADSTFLQNNAGCPDNNSCIPAVSASYYGRFAALGLPSNNLPTWSTLYTRRVASPTTATLTMGYEGGMFTVTLSASISSQLDISLLTAYGYTSASCLDASPSEVDIENYVTLLPGETYQIKPGTSSFPFSVIRYDMANTATINGTAKTNGQTIVVGGTTITVAIPVATCDPYAS